MEETQIISGEDGAQGAVGTAVHDLETAKYLLFVSGGLLFGAAASYVVEIITNHLITTLPLVPPYVRGIINLRGQIIPIVDIRLLLGQEATDQDCIVILNIDDTFVGVLVDSVQKMIDVRTSTILPSPSKDHQGLVSGMCSLADGQTMLVFDCTQLLCQS